MALALLFNRTYIDVRDRSLTVHHAPFPWPGGKQVQTGDLDQLYCQEYEAYRANNRPVYRIALHALTRAGDRIRVVAGLEGAEQGVYLEQLLERRLNIKDRPVQDEHADLPPSATGKAS